MKLPSQSSAVSPHLTVRDGLVLAVIALESDGWHVDYDLTDPLSAGGGPHYVIHPDTGDILARRHEQ